MFSSKIYVVGTQKYYVNESVLLSTHDIKPWLQKCFHVYKISHGFQKSNGITVKLISLKRQKEIGIYTLNVFNKYTHCGYSKMLSQ